MLETKCKTIGNYQDYLKNSITERDKFIKALNNNYSVFFRNSLTFALIEHHVLPRLISDKSQKSNKEIRIWSAACAAGQEAYSIAILCDEFAKRHFKDIRFRIFATDTSETEIQKAQKGVYTEETIKLVTHERLKTYFIQKGEKFIVNPQLKEYINFSVFDLTDEQCICPPESIYGSFDLIMCANVLFYYNRDVQNQILCKTNNCLEKNGWLVVGETENEIVEKYTRYTGLKESSIFQKQITDKTNIV